MTTPLPISIGHTRSVHPAVAAEAEQILQGNYRKRGGGRKSQVCLLYTSDAADDL